MTGDPGKPKAARTQNRFSGVYRHRYRYIAVALSALIWVQFATADDVQYAAAVDNFDYSQVGKLPSKDGVQLADLVVVKKAERKLYLVAGEHVLQAYDISLGLVPEGHKTHEGDFRTPEGSYELTKRNLESDFYRSIQISYPNEVDERHASAEGVSPGGQIMIHGQPNQPRYPSTYYGNYDWTDGCIAVSNEDMIDIWRRTIPNTPIQILP